MRRVILLLAILTALSTACGDDGFNDGSVAGSAPAKPPGALLSHIHVYRTGNHIVVLHAGDSISLVPTAYSAVCRADDWDDGAYDADFKDAGEELLIEVASSHFCNELLQRVGKLETGGS